MLFENEKLAVRILKEEDKFLLAKWLSDPAVLEFYEGRDNPFDVEKVEKTFFNKDEEVTGCLIVYEDKEIGYIQFYPLEEEERELYGYNSDEVIYGIDQFIGEVDYWNKGIGTLLVTSIVVFLFEQKGAERVVMDPQTRNICAIRCYEKCGFKKVKLLPEQEWHEGVYQDCWLMECNKLSVGK